MVLKFELQNCYGIGSLSETIDYTDKGNTAIVYAPNGTMKTSLTKTIKQLVAGKEPCDELYKDRVSSAKITVDGTPINKDNTYVYQGDDTIDSSRQISTFLANTALKNAYDAIYNQLDAAKKTLKGQIKNLAHSSDCEEEIMAAFKTSDEDNYFDCLLRIEPQLAYPNNVLEYDFSFNDVFDKKETKIRDFIRDNQDTIQQYFDKYTELLRTSTFFSSGPESFGTTHANNLVKSVGDNRFFLANHKFVLRDDRTITTKDEIAAVIQEEKDRILTDGAIKRLFSSLDDKLQKNEKLKGFKEVIQTYPELIPELVDYDGFQKKILRGYLNRCQGELKALTTLYRANKDALKAIVNSAKSERSEWEKVISLFNTRFFVPFRLELKNKSDVLLNSTTPVLHFMYQDGDDAEIEQERKTLLEHLSTGEKKAFIILQNIFELEAYRASNKQMLLVFDDIADSFDYKNKYAIIEYLNDLSTDGNFKILILTHNFDFYRTVVSRLQAKIAKVVNRKDEDRSIEMKSAFAKSDILKRRLLEGVVKRNAFIACIPFARNMIEYMEGNTEDYDTLTACLHLKKGQTEVIKLSQIQKILIRVFKSARDKAPEITFGEDNYLMALMEEAERVMADVNDIDIVNKLVLSMAIRLKAEQYMRSQLTEAQQQEVVEGNNLTSGTLNVFKKYHLDDKEKECLLMNRVLMLTSENIHVNNFMFEPLVDISIWHLRQLYEEVKVLTEI